MFRVLDLVSSPGVWDSVVRTGGLGLKVGLKVVVWVWGQWVGACLMLEGCLVKAWRQLTSSNTLRASLSQETAAKSTLAFWPFEGWRGGGGRRG